MENIELIYHITQEDEWRNAQRLGWYETPSLVDEGFIHCSYKHQVTVTAGRYYQGIEGLVLLEIDPDKLDSRCVAERSTDNALFPHVYGRINLNAVLRVAAFAPMADGTFNFPEELA
jgi:uncharacterized protein (DUF952 family)